MSRIHDALKKAELEKAAGHVPEAQRAPVSCPVGSRWVASSDSGDGELAEGRRGG